MGNNDEVFILADGSVWQVKYEYEYLYEYYPSVVVCPSQNIIIINNKKLNIIPLSKPRSRTAQPQPGSSRTDAVIESQIDGDFEGWEGETIYQLRNGQIWQQASYHYHYHYAYAPKVIIYKDSGTYKMQVIGDNDQPIAVRRIK